MAHDHNGVQPKVVPHRTLLGQRGVNLVEKIVMDMGCVWYPTGSVEAGIDGHIELRDPTTGVVLNTVIGVQSKAVDRNFRNETENFLDFYCDERDLDYWLKGNLPVLLVVSRPSTGEAYWVSVKDYFRDPAHRAARKVRFNKSTDRFDVTCQDQLFQLGTPPGSGIYLAPPIKHERLLTNLLPIAFLSSPIFVASTDCRQPRELLERARLDRKEIGGEWIIRNKNLISFCDLRRPEWSTLCDQGTVEEFDTTEWSETADEDQRRDFVHLLRRSLREMVRDDLAYHEKLEMFYVRATGDLSDREFAYQSLVNSTDRMIFKRYIGNDGNSKYYRHSAFHERFHHFDEQWFLEITPTYFFTSDGYCLHRGYERFLKKIKEIEGHEAIRGQIVMWASLLSPRGDMFFTEPYPFLGFGNLCSCDTLGGINDDDWEANRKRAATDGRKASPADKGPSAAVQLVFQSS